MITMRQKSLLPDLLKGLFRYKIMEAFKREVQQLKLLCLDPFIVRFYIYLHIFVIN